MGVPKTDPSSNSRSSNGGKSSNVEEGETRCAAVPLKMKTLVKYEIKEVNP